MRGLGKPRHRWMMMSLAILALAFLMLIARWTVGKMSGPDLFLPFIFVDYQVCGVPPQLTSPSSGAEIDSLAPLFEGQAGNDASGRSVYIEISLDEKFEHVVRTLAAKTGMGDFAARPAENLNPGTGYFWRAQLICERKASPFSAAQSFRTAGQVALPPAANLRFPGNAAPGIASPVELSWEAVAGAEEYRVYFRPQGPHGWYIATVTADQLIHPFMKGTTYEWYVIPRTASGYGPASQIGTFTTAQ